LLVQFSFIRTRHPFPIVLMDARTANVIGSRLSLGLSGVKAFAMAQAGKGIGSESQHNNEWNRM